MRLCPACRKELTPFTAHARSGLRCLRCGGRALSRSLVEWLCRADFNLVLGELIAKRQGEKRAPCPGCAAPMRELPFLPSRRRLKPWERAPAGPELPAELAGALRMDHCARCELLWLAEGSYEMLPLRPPEELESEAGIEGLSPFVADQPDAPPDDPLQGMAAGWGGPLGGVPFTENTPVPRGPARGAWTLALGLFAAGAWIHAHPEAGRALALGAPMLRAGYWFPLLTYVAVPAHAFEFLASLYLLVLFGRHAEGLLGGLGWVALMLLSALSGAAMHLALAPELAARGPASLVAGVSVFFSLALPHSRVGIRISLFGMDYWVRFPPIVWFGFWVLTLIAGALADFTRVQDQALFAPMIDALGGALAGFAVWLTGLRK